MAQEKSRTAKLTDQQLIEAMRVLLRAQAGAGSGASPGTAGQAEPSIGDILGEIVLHLVGALPDIIAEVVTEGIPDVAEVADVIGDLIVDVGKEITVHIITDVILDIILRPVDPDAIKGGQLGVVVQERIAHAKLALAMASGQTPAPSSRELAALRQILLKARANASKEASKE